MSAPATHDVALLKLIGDLVPEGQQRTDDDAIKATAEYEGVEQALPRPRHPHGSAYMDAIGRLSQAGLVTHGEVAYVGYPKDDAEFRRRSRPRPHPVFLLDNGRRYLDSL